MTTAPLTRPLRPRRRRRRPWPTYAALTLFALPWVVLPLWILVVNSFKSQGEASTPSLSWPTSWHVIDNYRTVIDQGHYLTSLVNSLIITVPVILAVILLGTMAAWAYARSSSRGLRFAYYATSVSIILPPAIIPTVWVLTQLGIQGTHLGYLLTLVGTRLGVVVFLTTGYIRALPDDYEEAAQLDGASKWRIYWSVILPLLSPVLFTAAVMLVINVWNDFLFALFLLRGEGAATLPLSLYQFASASVNNVSWNLVFAHVVLTSLPLLVAYIVLQRRVLSGLTDGGVTG
ncbi:MAG: carbohydrate ABC transporter permease [Nocardioides sp.]|uniref:carbohydrate ABC transporter permease n=1 Tax=Nocardioides sp. TaxID=35761 RepID=UPI0039E2B99A